jgi:uncharacterized protein (DUF2384 family)
LDLEVTYIDANRSRSVLNPVVQEITAAGLSLDAEAMARCLSITVSELAATIGVSRNTLIAKPASPKAEAALRPLAKILSLATDATGSADRAIIWFKYNPIISLGTKTPMEHVRDGHADWVLGHIENVLNGVYA